MSLKVQRFTDDLLLLEKLAAGGMAEVYRGLMTGVGGFEKSVAVKRILPECARVEEFKLMFLRETQLSANLQHPNIVQVFSNGEHGGYLYLVMEFVDGKSVDDMIARSQEKAIHLPTDVICFIIAEAARALAYAHSKKDDITGEPLNIVHRDVSPQNVMVSYDGNVKIVDFGIAKATRSADLTRTGVIKGKEGYLSPEQVSGQEADQQSDIFALGTVFYELLAEHALFESSTTFATLGKIVKCEIPPLEGLQRGIDPALARIVYRCLAKDREKRYRTADELLRELTVFKNRAFPEFTSADLAKDMRSLFAENIERERQVREKANKAVQEFVKLESTTLATRAINAQSDAALETLSPGQPFAAGGGQTVFINPEAAASGHYAAVPPGAAPYPPGAYPASGSGSYPPYHAAGGSGSYPSYPPGSGSGSYPPVGGSGSHQAFGPPPGASMGSGGFQAVRGGSGEYAAVSSSGQPVSVTLFPGQAAEWAEHGERETAAATLKSRRFVRMLSCLFVAACTTVILFLAGKLVFPKLFNYDAEGFWLFLLEGADMVEAAAFTVRRVLAPAVVYSCVILLLVSLPALFVGAALGALSHMLDLFFNAVTYLFVVFLVLVSYNFYIAVQQTDHSAIWFSLTARPAIEELIHVALLSPVVRIVKTHVANLPLKDFIATIPVGQMGDGQSLGQFLQLCLGYKPITETYIGLLLCGYLAVLVASVSRRLAFRKKGRWFFATVFVLAQVFVFSFMLSYVTLDSTVMTIDIGIINVSLPKSAWMASLFTWAFFFFSTGLFSVLVGTWQDD